MGFVVIATATLTGLAIVVVSRLLDSRVTALVREEWSSEGQEKELSRMRRMIAFFLFASALTGAVAGGILALHNTSPQEYVKSERPAPPDWDWLDD